MADSQLDFHGVLKGQEKTHCKHGSTLEQVAKICLGVTVICVLERKELQK